MPDAAGNIKGSGWSREREAGWERVFGQPKGYHKPPGVRLWDGWEELDDPAPEGAGSDEWSCPGCSTQCECCCQCC